MFGAPMQIVKVPSTLFEIIKNKVLFNVKNVIIFYVGAAHSRINWRRRSGEGGVMGKWESSEVGSCWVVVINIKKM